MQADVVAGEWRGGGEWALGSLICRLIAHEVQSARRAGLSISYRGTLRDTSKAYYYTAAHIVSALIALRVILYVSGGRPPFQSVVDKPLGIGTFFGIRKPWGILGHDDVFFTEEDFWLSWRVPNCVFQNQKAIFSFGRWLYARSDYIAWDLCSWYNLWLTSRAYVFAVDAWKANQIYKLLESSNQFCSTN